MRHAVCYVRGLLHIHAEHLSESRRKTFPAEPVRAQSVTLDSIKHILLEARLSCNSVHPTWSIKTRHNGRMEGGWSD